MAHVGLTALNRLNCGWLGVAAWLWILCFLWNIPWLKLLLNCMRILHKLPFTWNSPTRSVGLSDQTRLFFVVTFVWRGVTKGKTRKKVIFFRPVNTELCSDDTPDYSGLETVIFIFIVPSVFVGYLLCASQCGATAESGSRGPVFGTRLCHLVFPGKEINRHC